MENKELEMKNVCAELNEDVLEAVTGGDGPLKVVADQKDAVSALEEIINNVTKD